MGSRPVMPHSPLPRLILYVQTHFHKSHYVSLFPLLRHRTAVTHLIIAAIHLNDAPGDITINDTPWSSPSLSPLRHELRLLQRAGIKVLGMLGGAAKGTYGRLDEYADDPSGDRFRAFYAPLRDMVRAFALDGLDLDVEEDMPLWGIVRLITQLKKDFGGDFLITLAPVATAMEGLPDQPVWLPEGMRFRKMNISGFSYLELEDVLGPSIAWYNTQFYCGWGDLTTTSQYERILAKGWHPEKVVIGCSTSERNAAGWIPDDVLHPMLERVKQLDGFGGVMGWEYFQSVGNADMSGEVHHSWAEAVSTLLRPGWIGGEEATARIQAFNEQGTESG